MSGNNSFLQNKYFKIGLTVCVALCFVALLGSWVSYITEYCQLDIVREEASTITEHFLDVAETAYLAVIITALPFLLGTVLSFVSGKGWQRIVVRAATVAIGICLFALAVYYCASILDYALDTDGEYDSVALTSALAFQSELLSAIITSAIIVAVTTAAMVGDIIALVRSKKNKGAAEEEAK